MRGLNKLHPDVKKLAELLVAECAKCGLPPVLVTETWRSQEEQDKLYAQGRTTPGKIVTNCRYSDSPHCWGVAFDFCRNERGREYDDSDSFFTKVGEVGKRLGLFWGGDFKSFVDKPHFESPVYVVNNSVGMLKSKYGTPDGFKKTWGI
jgi:peptidoglycan L-alanyl-D-glutamate endopeptidase CwlK